jgi:tetratricopeptide (TPR) repeat protein
VRRALCVLLAHVLAQVGTLAQGEEPPPLDRTSVPRQEDARAQLALARAWKGRRIGAQPADRELWTRRAVDAYRAVRLHFPGAAAEVAEAAFRAGRLLAASDREEEALSELRLAVVHGGGTEFRERGMLEVAHVLRRRGDVTAALDAYHAVASDAHTEPGTRREAWWWTGELQRSRGAVEAARRAYRRVAEERGDPRRRVEAYDRLGLLHLEEGDLEAAAGVLHACRTALDGVARELTKQGARVRRALRSMRLVEELPRRIAARRAEAGRESSKRKP